MKIILLLIGCSLVLAIGFLIAFIWSVKSGQIDDTTTPAYRILDDDANIDLSTNRPVDDSTSH